MPTFTGTASSEVLTGGAGDDVITDALGGNDTLRGLGGNDTLEVSRTKSAPVTTVTLEGGTGDDLIKYYVFNRSTAVLDGGSGIDTFRLWAAPGAITIATGTGADILEFHVLNPSWGGTITVTDFTGGVGGDRIEWGSREGGVFSFLAGWDGGNLFSSGHLKLTQVGADAVLTMDLDGAAGATAGFTFIVFQNTQASSLTSWNFDGFNPLGGGVAGETFTGTAGVENRQGSDGDDTLSGLGGDDVLSGNRGDDRLNGGDGNDSLSGGLGDDVLDGGAGADRLWDLGGSEGAVSYGDDILRGGDGDDILTVSRWNANPDSVQLSGGAGADELHYSGAAAVTALLNGGAGDDTLFLEQAIESRLTLTTGTGSDTISLGTIASDSHPITVTDFATGDNGDRIQWNASLDMYLTGWNHFNPFQVSYARLVQDGANVLLQFNRTGGGETWKTFMIFQNTQASAFTSYNLGGYNPQVVPGVQLDGGASAESLTGGVGDDVIQGLGGDDVLTGGGGGDYLYGGEGRDILIGGAGDDTFDGGFGGEIETTYVDGVYRNGGDLADYRAAGQGITLDLNLGAQLQRTGQGYDSLSGIEDVYGSAYGDVITGNRAERGLLMGFAGNDVLSYGAYMVGGDGDDVLSHGKHLDGGDGNDVMIGLDDATFLGGAGIDVATISGQRAQFTFETNGNGVTTISYYSLVYTLTGVEIVRFDDGNFDLAGARLETIYNGTAGNDDMSATMYDDILNGLGGDDRIYGSWGDDRINGGHGIDTVWYPNARSSHTVTNVGGVVTVEIEGQTHVLTDVEWLEFAGVRYDLYGELPPLEVPGTQNADSLAGTDDRDRLTGLGGADILTGGLGGDIIDGGAGLDTADYSTSSQGVTVDLSSQTASGGDAEGDILIGIENATGSAVADTLKGSSGANVLDGGAGKDTLSGGKGDDIYYVDSNADVVTEAKDQGRDLIVASASFVMKAGSYVENLTLAGTANINGAGNGLANTLTGNAGNNILDGGKGDDVLIGGKGNDTYIVDSNSDVVTEKDGEGLDLIVASVSYAMKGGSYVENLTLSGTASINGTGNGVANLITGNAGKNAIDGGAGNDVLYGGAGDDTLNGGSSGSDALYGGLGNDVFHVNSSKDKAVEAKGEGTDHVYSSVDYSLKGQYIEYLTLTGSANVYAKGNTLDNRLVGNSGNNKLNGMEGQDRLTGGAGSDTFIWDATSHSTVAASDRIVDLTNADFIDLSRIDANVAVSGTQHFVLVDAFTHMAGQVTLTFDGTWTNLNADTNGDGVSDMLVRIDGDHTDFDNFIFGGG